MKPDELYANIMNMIPKRKPLKILNMNFPFYVLTPFKEFPDVPDNLNVLRRPLEGTKILKFGFIIK